MTRGGQPLRIDRCLAAVGTMVEMAARAGGLSVERDPGVPEERTTQLDFGRRQRRGRSTGEPETNAGAQAATGEPAAAPRCRLRTCPSFGQCRRISVPAAATPTAAPAAPCRARCLRPADSQPYRAPATTAATAAPTARAPKLRRARLHGGVCVVVGVRRRALSLHDGWLSPAPGVIRPASAPPGAGGWRPGRPA